MFKIDGIEVSASDLYHNKIPDYTLTFSYEQQINHINMARIENKTLQEYAIKHVKESFEYRFNYIRNKLLSGEAKIYNTAPDVYRFHLKGTSVMLLNKKDVSNLVMYFPIFVEKF